MSKAYSDQIYVTEAQFDALVAMELGLEHKNVMADVLHRIPNGRRRAPDVAYHKEIPEPLKGFKPIPWISPFKFALTPR